MKNAGKILFAGLILVLIFQGQLSAQGGRHAMKPDTTQVCKNCPNAHMGGMMMRMHGPVWTRPMQHFGGRIAMGPGFDRGFGPGFGRGYNFGPGVQRGQGIESIPGLSEKQKNDIAALRQKHQEEMQKNREEFTAKMQELREAHRKKIMDQLTEEQKKFLEEKPGPWEKSVK